MTAEELLRRYASGERDFSGVDLSYISLRDFSMFKVNFSNANLKGAKFTVAVMNYVNFSGADLSETRLAGEFAGCSFKSAHLKGANLRGSDLTGADFTDADLFFILCDSIYLENTIMPSGELVVEGINYIN